MLNRLPVMAWRGLGVLVVGLGLRVSAYPQTYEYVRGWGSPGNWPGAFSGSSNALGLAVDAAGNVFVGDNQNHRVQKFDAAGNYVCHVGEWGAGDGQLAYPRSVALDAAGRVYVADTNNHRIQRFRWDVDQGKYLFDVKLTGDFSYPGGLAVSSSGDTLFTAEVGAHRVRKFVWDGAAYVLAYTLGHNGGDGTAGSASGEFNSPLYLSLDPYGCLLVGDTSNHRIQRFRADGTFLGAWGGGMSSAIGEFNRPVQALLDAQGCLLVSDSSNHRIQKLDQAGNVLAVFGSYGTGPEQFDRPDHMALDAAGNLYIADLGNCRIQVIRLKTVTLSGTVAAGRSGAAGVTVTAQGCREGLAAGETYIEGVVAHSVSDQYAPMPGARAADGSGLNLAQRPPTHSSTDWASSWQTGPYQYQAWVIFDLGARRAVSAFRVWNFNLVNINGPYTGRGAKDVTVYTSQSPVGGWVSRGSYVFPQAPGTDTYSGDLFRPATAWRDVRYVKFEITTYWGSGDAAGHVGLSEVRFVPAMGSGSASWVDQCTTDAAGAFALTVPYGWSGQLRAFQAGKVFLPASVAVSAVTVDTAGQDFAMAPAPARQDYEFVSRWGRNGGDGTSGAGSGEMNRTWHVAVGPGGDVYVADLNNQRVQKFSPDGAFVTRWGHNGGDGTMGTGNGDFFEPTGIAVDHAGDVYVTDSGNHRVQKFDAHGVFLAKWGRNGGDGTAGTGPGEFTQPMGIAVDAFGHVLIGEAGNARIQEFDGYGNLLRTWTTLGFGQSVAVDGAGVVHTLSSTDSRVRRHTWDASAGTCQESASWPVAGNAGGFCLDAAGRVHVAETWESRVRVFGHDGTPIAVTGSGGTGDGRFAAPRGVAVTADGLAYVSDTHNSRIQKFRILAAPLRRVSFVAGEHGTLSGVTPQTVADGGSTAAVEAVPDPDYHFVQWWRDGVAAGSANPLIVSGVTADQTFTAEFAIDTHVVTFVAGEHGTLSGVTPQTVAHGGSTTAVEAVPDPGYVFAGWSDGVATNPRLLVGIVADAVLTAEFRLPVPVDPVGGFAAQVGAVDVDAGRALWDISGHYETVVDGYGLVLDLVHDTKGKLTGNAELVPSGKAYTIPLSVKGSAKGAGGGLNVKLTLKGSRVGTPASLTEKASAGLTLVLTLNTGTRQLLGSAVGSCKLGSAADAIAGNCSFALAAGMDGTLGLTFAFAKAGSTVSGEASLRLSNGRTFRFLVSGKAVGQTAVVKLSGHPGDPPAKGIKIGTTVATLETGAATLQAFTAKGLGQALTW